MKSVIVHGALALIGLWLSYQTWTRTEEPEQAPGMATILECESSQLTSLEIESPSHTVSIVPRHSAGKTEYWITSQHKKAEPPAESKASSKPEAKPGEAAQVDAKPAAAQDANAKSAPAKDAPAKDAPAKTAKPDATAAKPDATAAKPAAVKQARPYDADAPVTFLASSQFDAFLKLFAPLRAQRDLGVIPKGKFAQFGFDKVGTFLRVACGDHKVALDVGGHTYGSNDSYVRDPKSGQAYLIGGQMLIDLQSAQYKFMHTELRDFALSDVDEAVISARGQTRRLSQRNRTVKEQARWVDAAAPDKRNELFATWFQRVERLKAKGFLGEGKQPGSDLQIEADSMQPVLTIEYKLEGKHKGKLELVRVDTKQGNFYYARSEVTPQWTVMYDSIAKQVEDDVALVVGAEEAPAKAASPTEASPTAEPQADEPNDALPPGHP